MPSLSPTSSPSLNQETSEEGSGCYFFTDLGDGFVWGRKSQGWSCSVVFSMADNNKYNFTIVVLSCLISEVTWLTVSKWGMPRVATAVANQGNTQSIAVSTISEQPNLMLSCRAACPNGRHWLAVQLFCIRLAGRLTGPRYKWVLNGVSLMWEYCNCF